MVDSSTARAGGALRYEAQRARALTLAERGRGDAALDALNEGWGDEWPEPAAYAADVARIRIAVGDYEHGFEALRLSVQSAPRVERRVPLLLTECVRSAPTLWRRALRLAAEARSPADQLRLAYAAVTGRFA